MIFYITFLILYFYLSRPLLNRKLLNLFVLCLFVYWLTYPLESLEIGNAYSTIPGIKEVGIIHYAIFAFSFLAGLFLTSKLKIPKVQIYPDLKNSNNLFFISIFLGIFGFVCFAYTYSFSIDDYFTNFFSNRVHRMAILSSSRNALPYSISFIPSIALLPIIIKREQSKWTIFKSLGILFIFIINCPIMISYLLEGDRTSLIKAVMVLILAFQLKNDSFENIEKSNKINVKNRINKKYLIEKLKLLFNLFLGFLLLTFIGLGRGNGWQNINRILINLNDQYQKKALPTSEFRSINFTIDYAIARNYLSIEKEKDMFTWDKGYRYILPTYVYKRIYKNKKPPNIGDAIGQEIKKYVYSEKYPKKIGFGLSPVAEGFINKGILGIAMIGFIYGSFVFFLQAAYNKICLKAFNFFDLITLCSVIMIPLMMRSGSLGIYNWIFSISFVSLIPITIIELLKKINFYKSI